MKALERHSEPYHPTGSLAAVGVLNQLGRPDIEPLEVLVREAVQNSWDARQPDVDTVRVMVGRRTLDEDAAKFLRKKVLADPPPGSTVASAIRQTPELLFFADFGTHGLGGPTRADLVTSPQDADFVDFVLNVGQPPDKELGGGSFGYGKAAFFIASAASAVLVDTLCLRDGEPERRVIAIALGEKFTEGGRPFTGRHWWGRIRDGVPSPVTGQAADELASRLGLPERTDMDGLGTTVAVIAPDLDPDDGGPTPVPMSFIAECLAWDFWPKMIGRGEEPPSMLLEVEDDGRSVPVPDPRRHPVLRPFTEAMDRIRDEGDGLEDDDPMVLDRPVDVKTPRQRNLGRLVIQRTVARPDLTDVGHPSPQGANLTRDGIHHVALMRAPELVVKYLEGPEPTTGRHGYAGVFRSALSVEAAFRQAEPPTHDDWVPRAVKDRAQRSVVSTALRRIKEICREVAGVSSLLDHSSDGAAIPLGAFADALAGLMPAIHGPGARRQAVSPKATKTPPPRSSGTAPATAVSGRPGGGDGWTPIPAQAETHHEGITAAPDPSAPRAARPAIRIAAAPELRLSATGEPEIVGHFELRSDAARVRLRAEIQVLTSDGVQVEAEPPAGWSAPQGRHWIGPEGETHEPEPVVSGSQADGEWTLIVPAPADTLVAIDIRPAVTAT